MIISLIEMLELPNFGHEITSTIQSESRDKFFCDVMDRSYDVPAFISKYLFERRPRAANFADIIEIAIMFIKPTIQDSKKVQRIRNYVLKHNLYLYFLIKQKLRISGEKMLTLL